VRPARAPSSRVLHREWFVCTDGGSRRLTAGPSGWMCCWLVGSQWGACKRVSAASDPPLLFERVVSSSVRAPSGPAVAPSCGGVCGFRERRRHFFLLSFASQHQHNTRLLAACAAKAAMRLTHSHMHAFGGMLCRRYLIVPSRPACHNACGAGANRLLEWGLVCICCPGVSVSTRAACGWVGQACRELLSSSSISSM
jgi:hypothetical protein